MLNCITRNLCKLLCDWWCWSVEALVLVSKNQPSSQVHIQEPAQFSIVVHPRTRPSLQFRLKNQPPRIAATTIPSLQDCKIFPSIGDKEVSGLRNGGSIMTLVLCVVCLFNGKWDYLKLRFKRSFLSRLTPPLLGCAAMADVPSLHLSLMRRLDFQEDFSEDEEPASSPAHTRSGAETERLWCCFLNLVDWLLDPKDLYTLDIFSVCVYG